MNAKLIYGIMKNAPHILSFGLFLALIPMLSLTTPGCQSTPDRTEQTTTYRYDPNHPMVRQGRAFVDDGLLESALTAFNMALEDDPHNFDAHVGIGEIYYIKGDYATAARSYEQAIRIEPNSFEANFKLGLLYHLMNDIDPAVRQYLTSLSIMPKSFEANLNLATAYLQMRQPTLGLPYGQAATHLNPESQPAWVNLGSIYAMLSRYEDAIDAYRTANEMGELKPEILLNLADVLLRSGAMQQAMNTLNVLANVAPSDEVYRRMGFIHFRKRQFNTALEHYDKALEMNPQSPTNINAVGACLMTKYIAEGREDLDLHRRAMEMWRRSLQINPNQPRVVDWLARYSKLQSM